jgi:hypothetical protein
MNEIAKLIEAYNRLWENIEVMRQDIINILETDFSMEYFHDGDFDDNVVYNIYFKDKVVLYIFIDLSAEIPFLQIFKINVLDLKDTKKIKKVITKDYMKEHKYKDWNPNNLFEDESVEKKETNGNFISLENNELECISSPKIDILSINSTDIVNSEIRKLLSCMVDNNYKEFSSKELKIIE